MALPSDVDVSVGDGVVTVSPLKKTINGRSIWGTVRANINNMVWAYLLDLLVIWK